MISYIQRLSINKGTTWVEEITWLIQNDLNFEQAKRVIQRERVGYLNSAWNSRSNLEKIRSPRVFKTHAFIGSLPQNFNKIAKVKNNFLNI